MWGGTLRKLFTHGVETLIKIDFKTPGVVGWELYGKGNIKQSTPTKQFYEIFWAENVRTLCL